MIFKLLKIGLFCLLFFGCFGVVNAQDLENCPHLQNFPNKEELPDGAKERMIKLCIEEQKKDFEELVKHTEEVAKLSKEIEESFEENNQLSTDDKNKLKNVEDLVNKIRKELRADNDGESKDNEDEIPQDTLEAIKKLQETTTQLLEEIKKTTRHSISATAIQSTYVAKKIIKFLRFGK